MIYVLLVVLILLDQITKNYVVNTLSIGENVSVIRGFFDITYERNTGSAFSFFADASWGIYILTAISLAASLFFLYFLIKNRKKFPRLVLIDIAVLAAGTIGNLIDRVLHKSVVDFFKFTFGSYVFPIFNVADICVVVGTIGLMILVIKHQHLFFDTPKDQKKSEDSEIEDTV